MPCTAALSACELTLQKILILKHTARKNFKNNCAARSHNVYTPATRFRTHSYAASQNYSALKCHSIAHFTCVCTTEPQFACAMCDSQGLLGPCEVYHGGYTITISPKPLPTLPSMDQTHATISASAGYATLCKRTL